jgi:hypothetical protein
VLGEQAVVEDAARLGELDAVVDALDLVPVLGDPDPDPVSVAAQQGDGVGDVSSPLALSVDRRWTTSQSSAPSKAYMPELISSIACCRGVASACSTISVKSPSSSRTMRP